MSTRSFVTTLSIGWILCGLLACSTLAIVTPQQPAAAVPGTPTETSAVKGQMHVIAGREAHVYTVFAFDKACQPIQPVIAVDQAPMKGAVSFKPSPPSRVQQSLSGNCIGAMVPGTLILYTARNGELGADSFTISARNATGELGTRTFNLHIDLP